MGTYRQYGDQPLASLLVSRERTASWGHQMTGTVLPEVGKCSTCKELHIMYYWEFFPIGNRSWQQRLFRVESFSAEDE